MSSTSMRRWVLRWLAFTVVLGTFATAAPPAAQAATQIGYHHQDLFYYDSLGQPVWGGSMQMVVYSDHRKELKICDQAIDTYKAVVEIDPSGGGPPDTLLYADANFAEPGCGNYTFWYSARKWRPILKSISPYTPDHVGEWRFKPLPHYDF